jgi:hypothetical protein
MQNPLGFGHDNALKLRDFNYMEYYRRPVLGSGNTNRRYAADTNFVLHVGQRTNLALPVSDEGSSWNEIEYVFCT